MGLINGSLQIGRSAILANQSALQVIGNNIANAGNPNYTRQTPVMSPVAGSSLPEGFDPGAGVQLTGVTRNIDEALEERLRVAISNQTYDETVTQYLSRLEALYNELTNEDISSGLTSFLNAFSDLNTNPQDATARTIAINEGASLVQQIQTLRQDIVRLYDELGNTMSESVDGINAITKQIADLNVKIANATSSGNTAGALLDQRDTLLKDLAELADIKVIDQIGGTVTVYLGSDPLVQYNQARQLELVREPETDVLTPHVYFTDTGKETHIEGGKAGAVDELINQVVTANLDDLDTFAAGLIFEVNKLHSSGQGLHGYTEVSATNLVSDPDAALNAAGLPFTPQNGSFMITVRDKTTDPITETVSQININLNSTLTDLANQINAIDNVNASITADGRLTIATAGDNFTITFNDDTSNVLACLGINTFFNGSDAGNIKVNQKLIDDPALLACGSSNNPLPGDGSNAGDIFNLKKTASNMLKGMSVTEYYQTMVGELGSATRAAQQRYEIHAAITDTLQSQREAVSGVSIDEETINLMTTQRAFQGAARFVTVINELLDEVLKIF
jgi:flagellar hook-associated protein 1 FlgK